MQAAASDRKQWLLAAWLRAVRRQGVVRERVGTAWLRSKGGKGDLASHQRDRAPAVPGMDWLPVRGSKSWQYGNQDANCAPAAGHDNGKVLRSDVGIEVSRYGQPAAVVRGGPGIMDFWKDGIGGHVLVQFLGQTTPARPDSLQPCRLRLSTVPDRTAQG